MDPEDKADILLVDDQPANLLALEAVLEGLGQNLVKVNSGTEALRYLLDHDVALILMDIKMPGMDGYEAASLIQDRERSRHTPIIFLTGYERTDAQMFKGYSVGAVDFLTKPFVPEVLRSKVAVFVDLFRKREEVKRQAEVLREMERREHERQLQEATQRFEAENLRREMQLAREIQQKLFPDPVDVPGVDIGGACYPADATGGDYFDYIPLTDNSLGLVIGDVSGHGIGAALVMAATRAYLHALAMSYADLEQILTLTNRALVADVGQSHFVTLLLASLNPRTRSLVYTSAGHSPGYVLSAAGEVKEVLRSTATPLGIMDGQFPASPAIGLAPGDLVFLFTDGLVESWAPDGTQFEGERALTVVRANQHRTAQEIVAALFEAVRTFADQQPQLDDITAIVIKVNAAA
jgi:serine phosphatase RsbU (regulator of sigma subunit)